MSGVSYRNHKTCFEYLKSLKKKWGKKRVNSIKNFLKFCQSTISKIVEKNAKTEKYEDEEKIRSYVMSS